MLRLSSRCALPSQPRRGGPSAAVVRVVAGHLEVALAAAATATIMEEAAAPAAVVAAAPAAAALHVNAFSPSCTTLCTHFAEPNRACVMLVKHHCGISNCMQHEGIASSGVPQGGHLLCVRAHVSMTALRFCHVLKYLCAMQSAGLGAVTLETRSSRVRAHPS